MAVFDQSGQRVDQTNAYKNKQYSAIANLMVKRRPDGTAYFQPYNSTMTQYKDPEIIAMAKEMVGNINKNIQQNIPTTILNPNRGSSVKITPTGVQQETRPQTLTLPTANVNRGQIIGKLPVSVENQTKQYSPVTTAPQNINASNISPPNQPPARNLAPVTMPNELGGTQQQSQLIQQNQANAIRNQVQTQPIISEQPINSSQQSQYPPYSPYTNTDRRQFFIGSTPPVGSSQLLPMLKPQELEGKGASTIGQVYQPKEMMPQTSSPVTSQQLPSAISNTPVSNAAQTMAVPTQQISQASRGSVYSGIYRPQQIRAIKRHFIYS